MGNKNFSAKNRDIKIELKYLFSVKHNRQYEEDKLIQNFTNQLLLYRN